MTAEKIIPAAVIRRAWLDRSRTLEAIAAGLGLTRQGLAHKAKQLGLPQRGTTYALQRKGSDDRFRALWTAGVSVAEIARLLGYANHRGVCQRRKALGLPSRTRGRGKGNGRGWKETVSLDDLAQARLAARLAASAAETRSAMRLAEMLDGREGRRSA